MTHDNRAQGRRKSNFIAQSNILSSDTFDFVRSGTNFKIPFSDFVLQIGALGTLEAEGAITGTPVLTGVATDYKIRNLEDGNGIKASVSPENGITLDHNFQAGAGGVDVLINPLTATPTIRALVAGDGVDLVGSGDTITVSSNLELTADGAAGATPVLDGTKPNYIIRSLENGSGIQSAVSGDNGVSIAHNFTQDNSGVAVLGSPAAASPVIRSITGVSPITATLNGNSIDIASTQVELDNLVIVKQASDLSGTLDTNKQYFIDGVIDMGTQSIEVPAGGISLVGYNFNLSKLISSENNYTMFTSPVGGSGDFLGVDYAIEVTGTNSKVYDLKSATANDAFEFSRINYNGCTSLGSIDNYRQGFETGTGRFGGSPTLELIGAWAGGYFVQSSIVRVLDAGMTTPLFKAGAGFSMSSRFFTNMNVDLPASAALLDFAPSNFVNPSTLQIQGAIVTRGGVSDPEDANLTPNIAASDLVSSWDDNNGLNNTFEGGRSTITVETASVIAVAGTYVDLAGTWTTSSLEHFDAPANGQLRHLGNNPRNYNVIADMLLDGTSNDEINVKIVKWDNSASAFVDIFIQKRVVNALVGGRDVAFFNINFPITLDQNDYVKLQVTNVTATNNVTAEIDSYFTLQER